MRQAVVTSFDGLRTLEQPVTLPLTPVVVKKAVDTQPPPHGTLSAELRAYLMERRRALLTELNALNKMLGLKTE